jgi:hypothetical protein
MLLERGISNMFKPIVAVPAMFNMITPFHV